MTNAETIEEGGDAAGWRLTDGTQIHVRGLRADDRERELAFFESLSEQTRYFRLMAPLRYLSLGLLDQLMDVNGGDRTALVASVVADGQEQFIGVARYAPTDITGEVELGITVADAWQRRGIASSLLQRLIEHARIRGVQRIVGLVLPENHRMLALARKLGFTVRLDTASRLMSIEKRLA
jgi:RimJ/RimL family protein N-acetyltransferase